MKSTLVDRLGDIPGVASVVVDLEGFGRGIDVRLEPGADEAVVMEKLRALLAAYGVRKGRKPAMGVDRAGRNESLSSGNVKVMITPMENGARIEVATSTVKSFRVVAATPLSLTQGLADAWCQVIGRVPVEIVGVQVDDQGRFVVTASDGDQEGSGAADTVQGWLEALIGAVSGALADFEGFDARKAAS